MTSIIIPAFNRASTLPRAVRSACAQTDSDLEIIVVDDGSGDDTPSVLRSLSLSDRRLRVLRQANLGASRARNAGAAAARGHLLAFLDSDDALAPTHIENRVACLAAHPAIDLLWGGVRVVGRRDRQYVHDIERPGARIHLSKCRLAGGLVVRREAFERVGGFDGDVTMSEDYEFLRRIERCVRVERAEPQTYLYHVDGDDRLVVRYEAGLAAGPRTAATPS